MGKVPGVAIDGDRNIYVADRDNNIVVRISPDGLLSVAAGNGVAGFSGDGGTATSAELRVPNGVVVDTDGNLYIADAGNNRVRKVAPSGVISTVAGNGNSGFS